MAEIQHGTVKVEIPDEFTLPAQAGNMSPEDVRRIAKAPRGLGLVCDAAADVLEKSASKFTAPAGVRASHGNAGVSPQADPTLSPKCRGYSRGRNTGPR